MKVDLETTKVFLERFKTLTQNPSLILTELYPKTLTETEKKQIAQLCGNILIDNRTIYEHFLEYFKEIFHIDTSKKFSVEQWGDRIIIYAKSIYTIYEDDVFEEPIRILTFHLQEHNFLVERDSLHLLHKSRDENFILELEELPEYWGMLNDLSLKGKLCTIRWMRKNKPILHKADYAKYGKFKSHVLDYIDRTASYVIFLFSPKEDILLYKSSKETAYFEENKKKKERYQKQIKNQKFLQEHLKEYEEEIIKMQTDISEFLLLQGYKEERK